MFKVGDTVRVKTDGAHQGMNGTVVTATFSGSDVVYAVNMGGGVYLEWYESELEKAEE